MPFRTLNYVIKLQHLREMLGGRCLCCGKKGKRKRPLEFAHLRETPLSGTNSRGARQRYLDIVRNPRCYTMICSRCHQVLDLGGIEEATRVLKKVEGGLEGLPPFMKVAEAEGVIG